MAVYIDQPQVNIYRDCGPRFKMGQMFAHLSADTEQELIAFAVKIKLSLSWLQFKGTPKYHFDVTGRWLAEIRGRTDVQKVSRLEFARRLVQRRNYQVNASQARQDYRR